MDTWIYLGAALLVTGVTAIMFTGMALSGGKKLAPPFPLTRWSRAKDMTTAALGGADAVASVSQSGLHKPVSRRSPKASVGPIAGAD